MPGQGLRQGLSGAALLALLTACGADAKDDTGKQDVASLATGSPTAVASAAARERPLIRTDTSPDEVQRLYAEWQGCLRDHGLDKAKAAHDPPPLDQQEAAVKACAHKEPEKVWQRAKRTDPTYPEKLHEWITCIRAQGVDAWEQDGFVTYHRLPPDDQLKKVDECQDKVFGKG